MVDLTKLIMSSEVNYMKREPTLSDSAPITLPSAGATATITITHNLGYIPEFQIAADTNNDGILWSNHKVNTYTETSLSGTETLWPDPELIHWVTTTTLVIGFINHPGATGSRTVHWVIYLDYGDK